MDTQALLDKIVILFENELNGNLSGIYLHGSLAMGCFNPFRSDVDLLVVVQDKLTPENNARITKMTLALHDEMEAMGNSRGIEFTIIRKAYLKPFAYPTPFEYHYSDYHRDRYRSDEAYLCGGYEDSDLAAQIVVAYERGITLYGTPLRELYEPVDPKYYLDSILHDVNGLAEELVENPPAYLSPVYMVLNFCRVLYYLKEGKVASKREGGEWGEAHLPQEFQPLVKECLQAYNEATISGENSGQANVQTLLAYANYMTREIERANVTKPPQA